VLGAEPPFYVVEIAPETFRIGHAEKRPEGHAEDALRFRNVCLRKRTHLDHRGPLFAGLAHHCRAPTRLSPLSRRRGLRHSPSLPLPTPTDDGSHGSTVRAARAPDKDVDLQSVCGRHGVMQARSARMDCIGGIMSASYSWLPWALLSAAFAALTAIFGKIGVANINADLGTLVSLW
jgi:hypothetical protein